MPADAKPYSQSSEHRNIFLTEFEKTGKETEFYCIRLDKIWKSGSLSKDKDEISNDVYYRGKLKFKKDFKKNQACDLGPAHVIQSSYFLITHLNVKIT